VKKIFVLAFSAIVLLSTAACSTTPAASPATTATPAITATATPAITPAATPAATPTASQAIISIKETAEPKDLLYGAGSVKYTYEVINLGTVALSNVSVTDDKIGEVKYASGDANSDSLLQKGEVWIYTATSTLTESTTSIATAKGSANGITSTNTVSVRVAVSSKTASGGELPNTSTPWFNILGAGASLILLGTAIWRIRKFYE